MVKPCKNCPFKRCNTWGPAAYKIMAYQSTIQQRMFSCHELHPDANVFSLRDMPLDDCAGWRMMKENILSPNTHADIVNNFNETGPEGFNLVYWAAKEKLNKS